MQAHTLPFSRGQAWLQGGFALWRKNPALLIFLTFAYLLLLILISLVPVIGQIVAALVMPVLSVGILNGCRAVDQGRRVGPEVLFSGFRSNQKALFAIGGATIATFLLILLIALGADSQTDISRVSDLGAMLPTLALVAFANLGAIFAPFIMIVVITVAASSQLNLTLALVVAITLSTPVMMAYWFAPVLAGWKGLTAPKAMFFSLVACARNWRPLVGYSLTFVVFCAVLPSLVVGLVFLVSPPLGNFLSIPLSLILPSLVFASSYMSAREVFGDLNDPNS